MMSAFPLLNSKLLNKTPNEVKNECDKYTEVYKWMSIENKYKLMKNMSLEELETFKQCQIKWLKEDEQIRNNSNK
jgi:hypothetical protein